MQTSLRQAIIDIIGDKKCNKTADCTTCNLKQNGCMIYKECEDKADKILLLMENKNDKARTV